MNPIIYVIVITILSLFAMVFYIGVHFGRTKDEEKPALDWVAMLPYAISGIWGLIVIIKNGVVV